MNDQRIFPDDVEEERISCVPSRLKGGLSNPVPASDAGAQAALDRQAQEDLHWRCDFAWKVFAQNQSVITATDQKTYMLIVMSTLLVSLGSANIDRFVAGAFARQVALACLVGSAVLFFILALITLFARVSPHPSGRKRSLVYFAHVAQDGAKQTYNAKFSAAAQAELLDDLLDQLVQVSAILTKKMSSYRHCWIGAIVEVVVFLSMVLFGHLTF
jgi:hypothetical protein